MTAKMVMPRRRSPFLPLVLATSGLLLIAVGVSAWALSLFSEAGFQHWQFVLRFWEVVLLFFGIALFLLARQSKRQALFDPADLELKKQTGRQTELLHLPLPSYIRAVDWSFTHYVSPELEELLGHHRREWRDDSRLWFTVIHPADRDRVLTMRRRCSLPGQRFRSEHRVMCSDNRVLWVREEAVIVRDNSGSLAQHGWLLDITKHKTLEETLEHQGLHDGLTGLPNRTLLHDRLQQAIATARREGSSLALLLIDLDRFKEVNDTFGHQCGDLLLRQVVAQLGFVLRESDTIARLGGDEFAVILPGDDEGGAQLAVDKILDALGQPYCAAEQVLHINASIGIAVYPDHGQDSQTLLQRADVAMYVAKRHEDACAVYEPESDPYSPGKLALVGDLRVAIEHEQLDLHYQPKARLQTGYSQHVEALVRWNHPQRGFIPPTELIDLAEHAGLIGPLTQWVLNASLRQCHVWREEGFAIVVAVNLSARSLHDSDLVSMTGRMLKHWRLPPECLELEITEGALMIDPSRALDTLTRLHRMGIGISIDDFGTGYSSLSYLSKLPANQIKIDKSFVLDMARNTDSQFIVRSVIDLGHNLSLQVVAEGVEDQETWDMLSLMGCDIAQGYHLSHPLPAAELSSWLGRAAEAAAS